MTETTYVCPQCGPDAAGSARHSETHHTLSSPISVSPVIMEPPRTRLVRAIGAVLRKHDFSHACECRDCRLMAELDAALKEWVVEVERLQTIVGAAQNLVDSVRARHPGEALYEPVMIALASALSSSAGLKP